MTVLELAGEPARLPAEVQDLSRRADAALDCELLRVGLQNTPTGSALLSLGQRTSQPAEELTVSSRWAGRFVVVLGVRGTPHLVARSELPLLAAALYPRTGIHRVPAALTPLTKAAPQSTIPSGQRDCEVRPSTWLRAYTWDQMSPMTIAEAT